MRINFICVGQVKKAPVKEAASEYLKRINRYAKAAELEVRDEPAGLKTPKEDVIRKEGERLLSKLSVGDYTVALSDSGKAMTSQEFSRFIEGQMIAGRKAVSFIIGGAYGLHKDVYGRAGLVLSLSAMTLPHDLARLFLYEQVYRAFTIIKGEPYSH